MKKNNRSVFYITVLAKLGFSAVFLFLVYSIWTGADKLSHQLNALSDDSLAVHDLEVQYKNEVQEWKDFLLRSKDPASFNEHWQTYENKYQAVAAAAQKIVEQNDVPRITDPVKSFITAHAANFQQYKMAKDVLLNSGFIAHKADATVVGIDRPLLDYLEKAGVAMNEEQQNINSRVAGKTTDQIDQYLVVIVIISLLAVWMVKW